MNFIKKNKRLIIAVAIAIICIVIGVVIITLGKDEEKPSIKEPNREEQLVEATGMTADEAIEIVKKNFGSDNYEFDAKATNDGLYKVTVTNIINDNKIIYFVDPTNGNAYIDMETN